MTPIALGTSNAAKRGQLRWLLEGLPLEAVSSPCIAVPETAGDLAGNAVLKALAYSSGGLAIASDGGLVAPGLGERWDPVLTQRQGQARLRELTAGLADRRVRWSEAVAIAECGDLLGIWIESGTEGVLAPEPWPSPASEFWVWDVFSFPELGKTWSKLTAGEREQVDVTWVSIKRAVQEFLRQVR